MEIGLSDQTKIAMHPHTHTHTQGEGGLFFRRDANARDASPEYPIIRLSEEGRVKWFSP